MKMTHIELHSNTILLYHCRNVIQKHQGQKFLVDYSDNFFHLQHCM